MSIRGGSTDDNRKFAGLLQYLPASPPPVNVARGQIVYDDDQPASALFFLVAGRALISKPAAGCRVTIEICFPGQYIGFAACKAGSRYCERATTLDNCQLMFWRAEVLERLICSQPQLGTALLMRLFERSERFNQRLVSMATEAGEKRLLRFLIMAGEAGGDADENGNVTMRAIPHRVLADCVGASREMVTTAMNMLRRRSYLTYSRRELTLSKIAFSGGLLSDRKPQWSDGFRLASSPQWQPVRHE